MQVLTGTVACSKPSSASYPKARSSSGRTSPLCAKMASSSSLTHPVPSTAAPRMTAWGCGLRKGCSASSAWRAPPRWRARSGSTRAPCTVTARRIAARGRRGLSEERGPRGGYKLTEDKRVQAQHLLDTGHSLRAVAKAVAVSEGTVRYAVRQGQLHRITATGARERGARERVGVEPFAAFGRRRQSRRRGGGQADRGAGACERGAIGGGAGALRGRRVGTRRRGAARAAWVALPGVARGQRRGLR